MDFHSILQILQIGVIIVLSIVFIMRLESRIAVMQNVQATQIDEIKEMKREFAVQFNRIDTRFGVIDKDVSELSKVTIEIARQGERMTAQDVRLASFESRLNDHIKNEKKSTRSKG